MKIYVGNLSFNVTKEELQQEFMAFGNVASVDLVHDKFTGESKGFAFVEMPALSEGQAAVTGLNGKLLQDRQIRVSGARERPAGGGGSYQNRRPGGFRGGSSGGRGGGKSGGFGKGRGGKSRW
jgi:RNA recognition motif-containing protein